MMKPSRPSFLHRAFRAFPALVALALLPAAAHAASVNITVGSTLPGAEGTIWFERSNHPLRTGDTITILVPTTPAIDELSVVDGAGTNLVFNFRMRNPAGQVQTRQAHVVGVWDADASMAPENGCLAFEYTIQDTDSLVNGELLPPSGSLFGGAGIATAVLTESGDTIRSITGIRAPNPPGANTPFIAWLESDPPPVTINQQVAITSLTVEFSTESHGTLLYNTGKNYIDFFVVTEPALNPDTLPDDFALSFQFSEKDGVRTAPFGLAREGTGENGNNGLWFRYIIQESDYSGGDLFLKTGAPLFTTASGYAAIRTADGDRVMGLAQYAYATPDVAVATDIIVNPDNSNYISIYFLDSDGNRLDPNTQQNYWEGDRNIKYVVDIGRVPATPVTVTIDWGAANVFQQQGATDAPRTTTVEFSTSSSWTGTIDRVLDDGAAPTGSHEYNITATRSDGANSAIMKAIVLNIEPSFLNLGTPSNLFGCPSGTNYEYAVGAYITNRVMFSDPSYETLDEPMGVSWSHSPASTNAIESTLERNAAGGFWEATSIVGPLVQGLHTVSVSIKDKNGGNIYTNTVYYVPEPPPAPPTALLFADPSEKGFWGLDGIGDGTIEIVRPAGLTWVPDVGTPIPYDIYGNHGRVRGLPQQTADSYDSFAYRWRESLGKNSDQDPTLLDGYSPVSSLATVMLWTDDEYTSGGASWAHSPTRPVLYHLFSRELYRLDDFGDIDADGLGDEWELKWLQPSVGDLNWIPAGETEEVPLIASESGTPAPNYDFSGSGNLDADGLPVGCLGGSVKFQIREDGVLPMGVYDVNVFRYPLDIKNIKLFGYLPLGRDAVTGAESPEITAFTSNPYVDETAVNQIARICVNFDNLLEFRGVGTFQNVWDGVEDVSFRPVGDGDDPGTSPVSSDTDGDGLPDGWEYYFWAVAYYNVNPDQWLAFDGANPDGYTFRGTGAPIAREDILNAFRPNGGGSAEADLDNDGLSNYEEFLLGTNPIHWDTDGDGMPDGWEVEFGIANKTEQVLSTDADGNPVISIQETSSMVLNPLDPEDADSNADGDWMAYAETDIGAVLKHFDVYEAFDFDPRTAWRNPENESISYAGNTFGGIEYANTAKFTAREEFDLAAWYITRRKTSGDEFFTDFITPDPNDKEHYWGKWTTHPGNPDSDGDHIPDGWEAYVGIPDFHGDWHTSHNPREARDGSVDAEKNQDENHGDGLNNFHEFLCTEAIKQYEYLADYAAETNDWSNKPWPTNPNISLSELKDDDDAYVYGIGYADGCDTDGDQILDSFEKGPNTNPTCVDTDHDWLPDGWECAKGTDPLIRDTYMDYDGDGLQNWQEYLTGAVWAWQYDKWYDLARMPGGFGPQGPAYGDVDMFDFFVSAGDRDRYGSTYGGFGRHPHPWDIAFGARSRFVGKPEIESPFYFLLAEARGGIRPRLVPMEAMAMHALSDLGEPREMTGLNKTIVNGAVGAAAAVDGATEDRWTYSQYGTVFFSTADPWEPDSDEDGMSDFYEAYHGLNPLYGGMMGNPNYDRVCQVDPLTGQAYPSSPWDLVSYPWLAGDPDADPDKDGLSSREEAVNVTLEGGTHHTDPSPLWITDPSYERSFVNLYYQPGRVMADPMNPLWYFGYRRQSSALPPQYAFSFEVNEGYDTDNDNVADRSEVTIDELEAKSDPLDFDKPRSRKALYLNGVDAAARTRGGYVVSNLDKVDFTTTRYQEELDAVLESMDDLRTFTVEAWIRPENPVSGHDQTIVERGTIVPQDTAKADVSGKRLNFRLSLTPTGALRGEFHNYQGAHVTLETDAASTGLREGVWSHVAMTYSGRPSQSGTLAIYVNGLSLASTPSSLQAFNGILPIRSEEFASPDGVSPDVYRYGVERLPCPVVVGASDAAPGNEVNGHVSYDNGGIIAPDSGPALTDFFKGWIDEVRIWDGASSPEAIRTRMYKRFDRSDIAGNFDWPNDAVSGNKVILRYHYTFDSLPDVVPAGDRDPSAPIRTFDVETLPVGLEEVFTAPVDGSYPGVPWWTTAATRGYRYDARHIPWIENTVAHMATGTVKDDARVQAVRDADLGKIVGWRVDYERPSFSGGRIASVVSMTGDNTLANDRYPVSGVVGNLPNSADPYGVTYTTVEYGANHSGTAASPAEYSEDEGARVLPRERDVLDWASDLLPLGGAVADYDVELWDGLGMGYDLATVDTDGDGIPDWWEIRYGLDPFDHTDAWDDLDHDELDNLAEYLAGTSPIVIDSDGDGHSDYYDRDTDKSLTYGELYDDSDQMPSWWEYLHGLNPRRNDGADDPDGDGWSNYSEYLVGTDPRETTDHPNPPVIFNVDYAGDSDGNALSGDLYVYAYDDPEMQGRPNAVWMQNLHPKDNGYLQIDEEWCASIREGKWEYSGNLALANVANNGALIFEFYTEGQRSLVEFTVGNNLVVAENVADATWFYCQDCGKMYSRAQMMRGPGGSVTSCPRGHVGIGQKLIPYLGSTDELRCGSELWGTIDHRTGAWTITIPDKRDARKILVGATLVATYDALPNPVFPFQLRQKWTNMKSGAKEITSTRDDGTTENTSSTHTHDGIYGNDTTGSWIVSDGHLREGENRFFAFLDQNENALYDFGEPAGMAVYQPVNVGAGAVQVTIPLTDALTGYPRFGWAPAPTGKDGQPFGAEYFVSLQIGGPVPGDASTSNAVPTVLLYKHPVSSRPFFMENDVADTHGITLGVDTYLDWTWLVYTNINDTTEYTSGSGRFDVGDNGSRRPFSILAPTEGSVVSDPSLLAKWAMDWRNEGVVITLQNNDNGQTYVNGVTNNHPQRIGATYDNDYYFVVEPQKVFGGGAFVDLPDGHYTLTLAEYIQNSGVTARSDSVNFIIDRTGSYDPTPKTDLLGSITGTLTYFGKIPFEVTDETVALYDGQTKLLSGPLSHSPVPGTVTVRVINGATTNVVASDVGAFEGFTHQGLVSQYDTLLGNSYVTYGDQPAVSLQLDFAPPTGSRLVVSYKQYDCPILIQAFSTSGTYQHDAAADGFRLDGNERASFSGTPAVQQTVYNKGAFTLEGLPWGTYYLRAFIDQNANRVLDDWESVGYAMTVLRSDYGMDNYQAIEVAPGASHVEIVIRDRDTDSDQLPDAWEYYYFTNLVTQGGYTEKKAGVLLWQEYADGELDSNPLVEDTDADGLPDVIEHQIGSNNHAWDSDGDGIGDLEEFLAGSDPTDASSKARFAAPAPIFLEDGTPALVLTTPYLTRGTYLWYEVFAKDSLADENWILVGSNEDNEVGISKDSAAAGCPAGTVTIEDRVGKGIDAGFYKVKAHFGSDTILEP